MLHDINDRCIFAYQIYLITQKFTAMTTFTFKLLNTIKCKNVSIYSYKSTNGYFVETSQGLVSEYFKTKCQISEYIKVIKENIISEFN